MTFKQSLSAFTLAAFFLGGLSMCANAASPVTQAMVEDHVVARIDGTEIRRSDLVLAQQLLPPEYKKMSLEAIYPFLMKQQINNILVVHAARSEGLDKTMAVRRRLEAIERRLVEGVYLEHAAEGKVTDQVLRGQYKVFTERLRGTEEIHVRHILLDKRSQALAVIKELSDGADFAALARQKSLGPSKSQGGDLGYLGHKAMDKPFADAAFGLKVGHFTPMPVETQFGWHVIKLENRRATRIPSFEQMRPRLARQIRARLADKIVMKLRRNARIEHFDLNGKPIASSASGAKSRHSH